MIDVYAPIIPFKGLGGIKLYSTLDEIKPLLEGEEVLVENQHGEWTRYEVKNKAYLFFHNKSNKLFKITTLPNYRGAFNNIGTNTTEEELTSLDSSFLYDDFEEVFESPKGIFMQSNPLTHKFSWISVYIKELDSPEFDAGQW